MDSGSSVASGPHASFAPGPGPGPRPGPGCAPDTQLSLHARSFKLRFASQREPGRSYVSLVKPLGLPATVTGKFYCRERGPPVDEEAERRALERIEQMFSSGPRDRYAAPRTSAQVCGWHAAEAAPRLRADRRVSRPVRDSAWLRERLRVLAADALLRGHSRTT